MNVRAISFSFNTSTVWLAFMSSHSEEDNYMRLIQVGEFHGNLNSMNLAFPTWDIFFCPTSPIQSVFDDVLYGMYMSSNQTESSAMRLPAIPC